MKFFSFFPLMILLLGLSIFPDTVYGQGKPSKKDSVVFVTTPHGEMVVVLYEETPKHRSNFLKLAQEGFYKDLLFHRIIKEFMIQGGDPDSRGAETGKRLGMGGPGYRVDAEFVQAYIHKKGALAAARDNNPEKASSGSQFYIVQGKTYSETELEQLEKMSDRTYTDQQKEIYKTQGGTPHLDQSYTVFGEIISGLEVLDKIASQPTDRYDRPVRDVTMDMRVEVMKKKKVTKTYGYEYAVPEEDSEADADAN